MKHNTYHSLLDTLHYNTLFSSQEFKIDSQDNLRIVELSHFKKRCEVIPLDLIDVQPEVKQKPDTHLVLLATVSTLVSSIFFLSAFYGNYLWAISFGLVFSLSAIWALVSSYKNSTTTYTYQFANTNTSLFTLYKPFSENTQVESFVNALNKRITLLSEKAEAEVIIEEEKGNIIESSFFDGAKNGSKEKYSQYRSHLDFLFNYGIVDEALYKELDKKINIKVTSSERNTDQETDVGEPLDNIIYFPVNA